MGAILLYIILDCFCFKKNKKKVDVSFADIALGPVLTPKVRVLVTDDDKVKEIAADHLIIQEEHSEESLKKPASTVQDPLEQTGKRDDYATIQPPSSMDTIPG